jgi:hypothetical protein
MRVLYKLRDMKSIINFKRNFNDLLKTMIESNKKTKDRKRGKIVNSAFSAFLIPFIGGAILSFGTQVIPNSKVIGMILMGIASGLFIWGIINSTRDSIKTEERISELENQVKELGKRE